MANTQPKPASSPRQPRVLAGLGSARSSPKAGTARGAPASVAATPQITKPAPRPAPSMQAALAAAGLPRWAQRMVIGGVVLALGMPASVLLWRTMLAQTTLSEQSSSKAAMICTAGDERAIDSASLSGWLFGGSFFSCGDWETREARVQRDRNHAQAIYLARERARQGLQ